MAPTIDALAFSAKQVCRLTGLSMSQLRYWDAIRFFSPEFADEYGFGAFKRVYSFRDVVGLSVLGLLRKKYKFPLQELRPVGEFLHRYHETPWSGLALYVIGRDIAFRSPRDPLELISARYPGQTVMPIELELVARDAQRRVDGLRVRQPSEIGAVKQHRFILRNAPVLEGTRIPTAAVWRFHVAGYDADAIIKEYPRLTHVDVRAAIAFEESRQVA